MIPDPNLQTLADAVKSAENLAMEARNRLEMFQAEESLKDTLIMAAVEKLKRSEEEAVREIVQHVKVDEEGLTQMNQRLTTQRWKMPSVILMHPSNRSTMQ